MSGTRAKTLLFGGSVTSTARTLGLAVLVSVGLYVALAAGIDVIDEWAPFLGSPFVFVLVPLVLSTVVALRSSGLVGSVAMAVGPSSSYFMLHLTYASDPTVAERLLASAQFGTLLGVPIGIVGFLFGIGVRHLGPRFSAQVARPDRTD